MTELSTKYINNPMNSKASGSNRYKQGSVIEFENRHRQGGPDGLHLDQQHSAQHSHSANRHENNLAVNVASSGSLTTAATTKGSDFGTSKHQHQGQINHTTGGSGGGGTPQRNGSMSIMKEVFVPPRPTNTSRILHDQAHNQSMRKHRVNREQ